MSVLKIPELVHLVAASPDSIHARDLSEFQRQELEICREWDLPLGFNNCDRLCLIFDHEALIPEWIRSEVASLGWERTEVAGYLSIGSTNDEALILARKCATDSALIFAEHQTAGRGRQGRRWISPRKAGLYFSVLVRPDRALEHWPILTHAASVALARALQRLTKSAMCEPTVDIKWPNDVMISGKKVAGILLEVGTDVRSSPIAVVGVGVNVRRESVPRDLADRVTAVDLETADPAQRRDLLVSFMGGFHSLLVHFERGEYDVILDAWKAMSSMWKGVPVQIVEGSYSRAATTVGLTKLGALRVRTESGVDETIYAGDVSIRLT